MDRTNHSAAGRVWQWARKASVKKEEYGSGPDKPKFSMKGLAVGGINLSLAGRVWQWA